MSDALNKSLGLPMLSFYGIGMILGAGIYSIIGSAAGVAGEGLWQGFLLAALTSGFTALSYAELATMYPKAGAEYIYLRQAFSKQRWLAATLGIMMAFAGCATSSTVALAFAGYIQHFAELPVGLVSVGLLVMFTAVNILGIKESGWINILFTLIEVGGLVLFIWLGWNSPRFGEALMATPSSAVLSSAALIVFAYFGFENIVNLAEEAKDPAWAIPRAILISLVVTTILYVLVSLAAVSLISPKELAGSAAALTDAAAKSSSRIAGVLGGIALFSTANTALIGLVTTSRILYGISKDSSMPKILSATHAKRKTPWVAALVVLAVSLALLPLGGVEVTASVSSFATMLAFLGVNAALIALRFSKPNQKRPFRVPLSIGKLPLPPILGVLSSAILLFQFERIVYVVGLSALGVAAGIYLLHARSRART